MNKEQFDYLGISKWHELRIKGQGITIATRESFTEHGKDTYDVIKQVCPEANIRIDVEYDKDDDWDVYTTSLWFINDKNDKKIIEELNKKDKILFCSVGNYGNDSCSATAKANMLSVGACHLTNGKPKLASYSSRCEHLDFVTLSNLNTSTSKKTKTGTSFSTPLLAGMVVLVQCYFLKIRGKKLSYDEMLEYMKLNCIDLGEKGRDDNYGYGLFILPEIEVTNMFNNYTEYEKAIEYLAEKKEMDSPDLWKDRIKRDNDINLMWFCIKWANAVARS